MRRVRGDGVGEVAGGRARRDLETELERLAQRDRDDAVLEGVRGIARVVLDPHLAEPELGREPVGAHQRREAGAEVDRRVARDRQQVGVAPQARRPGRDLLAADRPGRWRRSRRRLRAGRSTTRRCRWATTGYSRAHSRQRRPSTVGSPFTVEAGLTTSRWFACAMRWSPRRLLSTRSRAPRAGDRSSATHRSGIGTTLEWPAVPVTSCWLPRRHRACPSAALDERVFPYRLARPDYPVPGFARRPGFNGRSRRLAP